MDTKYSPLHHGGLEAVERTDMPEVVPGSSPPLDRKSTMNNPEPIVHEYRNEKEHGNYYFSVGEAHSDLTPTPHSDAGRPTYFNSDAGEGGYQAHHIQKSEGRRYCGMRKAIFIALLAAIALAICVGAILGGVLGTVLPKKKSGDSAQAQVDDGGQNSTGAALQTFENTGIASTIAADGTGRLLIYYQTPDGRIVENSYLDGRWTLDDHAMVDGSLVTTDADAASPLAAVSYQKDGKTYRQVFYITSLGALMSTYSTTTSNNVATSWSEAEKVTDDPAMAGSIALGACTGPGLDGIRVYYPSNNGDGYINERRYSFSNSTWLEGGWFEQGDPNSGVACSVYNNPPSYQIVNVYYRNKATQRLQQSYGNYNETSYMDGPKASLNQTIIAGSDIAVCSDDTATEYVFFQTTGGMITKSTLGPDSPSFGDFKQMQAAAIGSKLGTAFMDASASSTGPTLTFQGTKSNTTMRMLQWSRSDASLLNIDVT